MILWQSPVAPTMNVLLLSMPDSFEHMPPVAIRMPNGALASLAGNVDPHHRVGIADLDPGADRRCGAPSKRLVASQSPDVVGLSVMTFQRATALQIARLVRMLRPAARIVVGGYDPSLSPESYEAAGEIDFVVRGEGEQTFRELLRALERGASLSRGFVERLASERLRQIPGLSFRDGARFVSNPARPVDSARDRAAAIARPPRIDCSRATRCSDARSTSSKRRAAARTTAASARSSRCAGGIFIPTRSIACSRTSRTPRAPRRRAIFLVDDNITLDVHRFEALCSAIIDAGFNDMRTTSCRR